MFQYSFSRYVFSENTPFMHLDILYLVFFMFSRPTEALCSSLSRFNFSFLIEPKTVGLFRSFRKVVSAIHHSILLYKSEFPICSLKYFSAFLSIVLLPEQLVIKISNMKRNNIFFINLLYLIFVR